jgi:uncharacterized membrane protein
LKISLYLINLLAEFVVILYQRLPLICISLFPFLSKLDKFPGNAVCNYVYYIIVYTRSSIVIGGILLDLK